MYTHGVDIIEISRIQKAADLWGERFLNRIYSEAELEFCQGRVPELASRFAGKEAVMKALGTGCKGISWREIEILPDSNGTPIVRLSGKAQAKAKELKLKNFAITLSHSKEYAIASVIGEGEE